MFSAFYHGALLWLLALVFGDLAAVWLLPSFAGSVLWILLGTAVALRPLLADQASIGSAGRHPRGRMARVA